MIQCQGTITKITTMRDKTIRLQVDTQEIPANDKAELFRLHESFGVFAFSESEIDENQIEVPDYEPVEEKKSPSARFRAALYVFWEKYNLKTQHPIFDNYYRMTMERYIDKIKNKIRELEI